MRIEEFYTLFSTLPNPRGQGTHTSIWNVGSEEIPKISILERNALKYMKNGKFLGEDITVGTLYFGGSRLTTLIIVPSVFFHSFTSFKLDFYQSAEQAGFRKH